MHLKGKVYLIFLVLILLTLGILYYFFNYHKFNFKGKVSLVTLGATKEEQVKLIKKKIEQFYGFSVTVLPEVPLPKEAYYQPRNRYKASLILKYLSGIKTEQVDKLIALVQTDLSVKTDDHEDWGIMGLAGLGGCCSVVSTFRLNRDHPSKKKFEDRLTKVALHEVGHTLGLDHCDRSEYCLMNDAKGSIKTIDKARIELCSYCKQAISYTKRP